MSKKNFIKRHILIINKIKNKPSTLEDLQKYLEFHSVLDEENYSISTRTLQRDFKEIASIYSIEIKFNRKEGVYEIDSQFEDELTLRIFETFTVLDTLKLAGNFSEEIVFEQRKSLGLENISLLIHAIKNNQEITFLHKKYWEGNANTKTLQPYFIKESKNRWYIVGLDKNRNQIRTFGLDRISAVEVLPIKFTKPPKTIIKNLFQNSFGIIYEEKKPVEVVLELSNFQAKYIKSLPLHYSQKVISENENYCKIQLFIHPTYDFIMEILSLGKEVKVMEPQSLKEKIKNMLLESLKNYSF